MKIILVNKRFDSDEEIYYSDIQSILGHTCEISVMASTILCRYKPFRGSVWSAATSHICFVHTHCDLHIQLATVPLAYAMM